MAAIALLIGVCALPASSAHAQIVVNGGNDYGVMPMAVGSGGAPVMQSALTSHGGPVVHASHVYLLYWDPTSPPTDWPVMYPQSTKLLIGQFLTDVSNDNNLLDNPFAVNTLYTDSTGRAGNAPGTAPGYEMDLKGVYTDSTTAYPTTANCTDPDVQAQVNTPICLTDAQIRTELTNFIAANSLPTGTGDIYLVLTPPGVVTCLDQAATDCSDIATADRGGFSPPTQPTGGYCGYHSAYVNGSNVVLYGQIPWPTPNITGTDTPGALPAATTLDDIKECQADGVLDKNNNPAVALPNGNTIAQPNLSNGGAVEVDFGDIVINEITHVLNATITDPQFSGYYDAGQNEAPDKCTASGGGAPGFAPDSWFVWAGLTPAPLSLDYGVKPNTQIINSYNIEMADGHQYYVQSEFDSGQSTQGGSQGQCVPFVQLTPRFVLPTNVWPNEIAGFDPSPTIATLGAAQYVWSFGDGSPNQTEVCAPTTPQCTSPSFFHSYTTPGTYTVTLTVTDGGGYTASASQQLTVHGTIPPPPPASGGSGPGTGAGAGTGNGSTPGSGNTPKTPAPTASTTVPRTTLSTALRKGVPIRYDVNSRLAGRFELLVSASTARHLHLRGTRRTIRAGKHTQHWIVVGKSLLETTRGGHGGLRIRLTRSARQHLRHAHRLRLELRLVARDVYGRQVVTVKTFTLR